MTGKFLCSIIESLVFPYSVKLAAESEEAWAGDQISVNDYGTITYFCVNVVPFVYDD